MKYLVLSVITILKLLFIFMCRSGFSSDVMCFTSWSNRVCEVGFSSFYGENIFCDYPPGYIFVLYFVGLLKNLFNIDYGSFAGRALLCMPSVIAEFVMTVFLCKTLERKNVKFAFGFSILSVMLNPLLILNTILWGQIDSFLAMFIVLSLSALREKKFSASAFYFAASVLIKPQALIFSPIYIYEFISSKNFKKILYGFAGFSLPVLALSFLFQGEQNFSWLVWKYASTLGEYNYFTVNAYNVYMLLGLNWKELFGSWGMIVYFAAGFSTVICFCYLFKSRDKKSLFFAGYLLSVSMFMLSVKMHERYALCGVILLLFAFADSLDTNRLKMFAAGVILNAFNIGLVLYGYVVNGTTSDFRLFGMILSVLNIYLFLYSLYAAFFKGGASALEDKWKSKTVGEILNLAVLRVCKSAVAENAGDDCNLTPEDNRKITLGLIAVVILYSCVAFYKLGDFRAPQTFYTTKGGEQIIMDFGEEKYVGRMMFYTGLEDKYKDYSENRGYELYYSRDAKDWFLVSGSILEHKYTNIFYWSSVEVGRNIRYFMVVPNKAGMMIGEIGFFGGGDNAVRYSVSNSEYIAVGDEGDKVCEESSYMNSAYFDEVYFPKTAYEILNRLKIYETTHPPLGKVIMAASMYVFGTTPFAYRLMGTLSGIIMLPLLYLAAAKLLKNKLYALFATAVFALDFMHFTQTRIATIDSFSLLFILCMYKFVLDYEAMDWRSTSLGRRLLPLFICSVFFGLGAATKWICVFTALSLAFIILYSIAENYVKISRWEVTAAKNKSSSNNAFFGVTTPDNLKLHTVLTFVFCILFFAGVSLVVYCMSYIPQMRYDLAEGQSFIQYIIESQKFMFDYHAYLEAEHPFSSKWYEWPLITRPLFAYVSRSDDGGTVSSISSFGNPAIWWFSLWTMIFLTLSLFKTRDKKGMFIAAGYFAQFLPWCFIQRTTFIYHYFASLPFAIISIPYFFGGAFREKTSRKFMIFYIILCIALFLMFYPVISGQNVSVDYIKDFLQWSKKWVFF